MKYIFSTYRLATLIETGEGQPVRQTMIAKIRVYRLNESSRFFPEHVCFDQNGLTVVSVYEINLRYL